MYRTMYFYLFKTKNKMESRLNFMRATSVEPSCRAIAAKIFVQSSQNSANVYLSITHRCSCVLETFLWNYPFRRTKRRNAWHTVRNARITVLCQTTRHTRDSLKILLSFYAFYFSVSLLSLHPIDEKIGIDWQSFAHYPRWRLYWLPASLRLFLL